MAEERSPEVADRTAKPQAERINAAHATAVRRMLTPLSQPRKIMEANVADQALKVQEKKELVPKGEKTVPARSKSPATNNREPWIIIA